MSHHTWRAFSQKSVNHLLFLKRYAHNEVRVRFAPSPTGYLHLGGLRTALYNFLYARHHGGKFILRIEDTDQTRLVPGATERLIEDLRWANIEIDEGPGFGGKHGPYVQSERRQIYSDAVVKLLHNGTAYRCFCTERRLELLRKEAVRTRQVPRYDNKCRHLTAQQTAELIEKSTPYCIRFKLSEHDAPLEDLIYGRVQHNVSANEGDPVIMKSDDFPTYHFANVVDDHMMRVSHVFRGVEWQISTTKHLLLYKAFGWQPPQFGHMPLLVNADGTKLSKRQGDIGVQHFRDKGYFPTALLNYVVSAGGGFERAAHEKPKIYTVGDLAKQFSIEKVNAHPSRLNPDLLDEFNRLEIIKQLEAAATRNELVAAVQQIVRKTYPEQTNLDLDAAHIAAVLHWSTKRLTFLKDLTSSQLSFLWLKPTNYVLKDLTGAQLQKLYTQLESMSQFDKDALNVVLKTFAKTEQLKFALLMKTLRASLSGLNEGPGVAEMMEILGQRVVLERLGNILEETTKNVKQKTIALETSS